MIMALTILTLETFARREELLFWIAAGEERGQVCADCAVSGGGAEAPGGLL
jgi:hypothetical protein